MAAMSASWMPVVGNAATLIAFSTSAVLSSRVSPGSDHAVFALAPVLLLLHEDAVVFTSLLGAQRYAPPLSAVVASLCLSAVAHTLRGPVTAATALRGASRWPWVARNFAALLAATPNASCAANYLWTGARVSGVTLAVLGPLNALAAAVTDVHSVRLLAGVSLATGAWQFFMQRSVRIAGMRCL
uniref:Uncharacterized protein n=1 Tax=Mantoniella antarctica TaxID=81844 RepID=A0A7S0SUC7_9CHLO